VLKYQLNPTRTAAFEYADRQTDRVTVKLVNRYCHDVVSRYLAVCQ